MDKQGLRLDGEDEGYVGGNIGGKVSLFFMSAL